MLKVLYIWAVSPSFQSVDILCQSVNTTVRMEEGEIDSDHNTDSQPIKDFSEKDSKDKNNEDIR